MKKGLRLSLILTCLLFAMASKTSFAQLPQTIEFGPHVGITTYQGDVNPWLFFNEFGYSLGGLVRYTYDTRWAFRADYSYGYVRASDVNAGWRPERGHAFQTKLHDVALIAEFNFMDYYTGRRESSVSPYLFAGISWFKYKAGARPLDTLQQVQFTGLTPDLNLDTTLRAYQKAYNEIAGSAYHQGSSFSIPFGFGCKFSLSQHLAASVEWRMHYTFTDNLDGIIRDESGKSLYPSDNGHQYYTRTWYRVNKKDDHGNLILDENNQPIVYDHFEYLVQNSQTPVQVTDDRLVVVNEVETFYYDLTDPTGRYKEGQQRGDASTNDWFGFLNFTITWKIPIPGNSACKILN
ncbi:MAG: outer membrane beta-barrel protein [Bacteroidales bacterium]|nr:outer membrane beta-barrel protein [Bacteroidales bacterium]